MSARPRIRFGEGRVFQLRIELKGIDPPIWRRVLVSARASLHELHDVIERALGPDGTRGYTFEVDGVGFTDPNGDTALGAQAAGTSLDSLGLHVGARFTHRAENHGDPWTHVLTIEQVVPRFVGQRLPSCVAGRRAAPPDEVSGPAAYRELLAAFSRPLDARSAELRSWLPEHFDPEYADLTTINAALARIPKHRPAA
ncbi:MAG: plasmid pRiA4b ORF-3 family protein [Gemmatimonadales bacterium]